MRTEAGRRIFLNLFLSDIVLLPAFKRSLRIFPEIEMSVESKDWIIRVAALNDSDLEEELKLINKNSLNAFTRALSRIRRPELDSHTYRNGTFEAHPDADTINLLLSIGETAISAINSEIPVSPVPWAVSPHMDINTRIKVLTRRIIIYKSELPTNNRANGPMPKYLQIRQFIGQTYLLWKIAFLTKTTSVNTPSKHSNGTMQYVTYTLDIIGFSLIIPSLFIQNCLGLGFAMNALAGEDGWTVMKQEVYLLRILLLLHSGKEFYLRIGKMKMNLSQANRHLFHSFEDDADDEVEVAATGSEMVISTSLGNLNI
ncbi:hypothetical protein BSLG_004226 [Batrachochytrium salamandrivorans]|nr:hypothetical protein BSLG_004226 [Batrachochytrium salamandrivorans]